MLGFAVVLILLLLAVQVVFALYARTVVTATAVSAARSVAAYHPNGQSTGEAEASAEQRARSQLGGYASVTTFEWIPSPDHVVLRVGFDLRASGFNIVGAFLPGLGRFHRTVRVRIERLVCARPCTVVGS